MATLNVADLNRQGKVFLGANTSAINHIAVNATSTGLILYNPIGSNVKVVLIDYGFVYTTVPGAIASLGLAMAAPPSVAPASVTNANTTARAADGSGRIPVSRLWSAATLETAPVGVRWCIGGAGATTPLAYVLSDRVDGSIVLVPGALVQTCAQTTTVAGCASFTWAEVAA